MLPMNTFASRTGRHAPIRRRALARALLLLSALGLLLSACGLSNGADQLAYLRSGALWVAAGDGSNAREVASGAIVSFAWSPDHHQLAFRTAASHFTAALTPTGPFQGAPEVPGRTFVVSINGGTPVEISPLQDITRSDAWWNGSGNRLLYREDAFASTNGAAEYVVSQNDQPAGIARKPLPEAASIPVLSADGARVAYEDGAGNVRLAQPGQKSEIVASGALLMLPGTDRPAHLLWQPGRNTLVYPARQVNGDGVTLTRLDVDSHAAHPLLSEPALLDAAFSPDGSMLLTRTPTAFHLWRLNANRAPMIVIPERDPLAMPYWSPDGRSLLVEDTAGMRLARIDQASVQNVQTPDQRSAGGALALHPRWRPASGSPWNPESSAFVLTRGTGALIVGTLHANGQITTGVLPSGGSAPSWTYADPSTVFLLPSE